MKKICKKKLFSPHQFYTLYKEKLSNLRPLLSITFSHELKKSLEKIGHCTLESRGKKIFKRSEKHQYQKNPAQ